MGASTVFNKRTSEEKYRASNKSRIHRYAGLLRCGDCRSCFIAKKRSYKGETRNEYVCNAYHRYGKEHCAMHRIREEVLDEHLYNELLYLKNEARQNWKTIQSDIEK